LGRLVATRAALRRAAHGVTLSQTQHDFAQEKIKRLGLQDRVTVELRDYAE
jgi:cyclopropane-fatty-acyl-phospholipid synthase